MNRTGQETMYTTAEQLRGGTVVCQQADLVANGGVAVLLDGQQIALFYLPDEQPALYALSNWDPIGKANVMSRGILGDKGGELVVASPLYKQHFRLSDGQCLEDADVCLVSYPAVIEDGVVLVST